MGEDHELKVLEDEWRLDGSGLEQVWMVADLFELHNDVHQADEVLISHMFFVSISADEFVI